MLDQWFPCAEGGNVVGKFVDADQVDVKASEVAGKTIYRKIPVLLAKFPGSIDVSSQAVKPSNQRELVGRFPEAWDHYQDLKSKELPPPAVEVISAPKGIPLDRADFLPRDKVAWLHAQGFTTVEHLRDMSDSVVQNLGRGAATWRKKAGEFLART